MKRLEKILITSNNAGFKPVATWAKQAEIQVVFEPFIQVNPILNSDIPVTDWLFFSSPKGARAYLENYPVKASKIAVFGRGTERVTAAHNIKIDFQGKSLESPYEIARRFGTVLTEQQTVFFPLGNRSRKTIIQEINPQQVRQAVVYETELVPKKLDFNPDCILFTSPSNFFGYLAENSLHKEVKLVAIGPTTAQAIETELGHSAFEVLESPTAEAFLKVLKAI